MFNIATSLNSFASPTRMDTTLRQIAADRPLDGNNFSGGVISYKFSASSRDMWFVPDKSYLRMRCRLYYRNSTTNRPLQLKDGIAPSLNLGQALFDNVDFLLGGKSVTSTSNMLPSVATLMSRMSASNSHLNCIGDTSTMWEGYTTRLQRVCSNGQGPSLRQYTEFSLQDAAVFKNTTVFSAPKWTLSNTGKFSAYTSGTVYVVAGDVDFRDVLAPGDELYEVKADGNIHLGIIDSVSELHANMSLSHVPPTALSSLDPDKVIVRRHFQLNKDNTAFTELEIAFKPPSPIFYSVKTAIPQSGQMELRLHASQHYRYNAVEVCSSAAPYVCSSSTEAVPANRDGYLFEVISMYLYIYEVRRDTPFNSKQYFLDLHEIEAQVQNVTSVSTQTLAYNVPPKTKAITVAYLDSRVVSDPRTNVNIFNVSGPTTDDLTPTAANSKYMLSAGRSRPVNHQVRDFQMQYAGRTFPLLQDDAELSLPSDTALTRRNFMTHRWLDTLKWENKDGSQVD